MVKRGEVYFCNLSPVRGSEQGGTRPVVVIQNDKGNKYSNTIIVAPISKKMSKPPIPTHVIFSCEQLSYTSMILLEQIRTVDKSRLQQKICSLSLDIINQINDALKISLDLS